MTTTLSERSFELSLSIHPISNDHSIRRRGFLEFSANAQRLIAINHLARLQSLFVVPASAGRFAERLISQNRLRIRLTWKSKTRDQRRWTERPQAEYALKTMSHVFEVNHPLIDHHLTHLRNVQTKPAEFRRLIHRLAVLLAYEATKDLDVHEIEVQTPLTTTRGRVLGQRVGLVPILRAGLGMVEPVLELIPNAEVWHLGLYRDEATAKPVEYYSKLPPQRPVDVGLVLDPMLATGGSATVALQSLTRWGVPNVKLLSVIASLEGIGNVAEQFPDTPIFVCAIDPELNQQKFIVPGLGDAGDRSFNTDETL